MKEYTLETMAVSSPQKSNHLMRRILSLKTLINLLRLFVGLVTFGFLYKIDWRFFIRLATARLDDIRAEPLAIAYFDSAINIFNLMAVPLIVLLGHWSARVKKPALALSFGIFTLFCLPIGVALMYARLFFWTTPKRDLILIEVKDIREKFSATMRGYMKNYNLLEAFTSNQTQTRSWDILQQTRECCGLQDPLDWNSTRPQDDDLLVVSCCPIQTAYGVKLDPNFSCKYNASNHFKIGCLKKIDMLLADQLELEICWLYILGAVSFASFLLYFLIKRESSRIEDSPLPYNAAAAAAAGRQRQLNVGDAERAGEQEADGSELVTLTEVNKGGGDEDAPTSIEVPEANEEERKRPTRNGLSVCPPKYMDAMHKLRDGPGTSV